MSRAWGIKKVKSTEPYRYLIILMEDDGRHVPCGHERYQTEQQAIARAKYLTGIGRRCDVMVDIAASYGKGYIE